MMTCLPEPVSCSHRARAARWASRRQVQNKHTHGEQYDRSVIAHTSGDQICIILMYESQHSGLPNPHYINPLGPNHHLNRQSSFD